MNSTEDEIDDPSSQDRPWKELKEVVETASAEQIEEFVSQLPGPDVARAIAHLSDQDRCTMLTTLEPDAAAELIEQLPESQAADLIEHLAPTEAAEIVDLLPSDERADILNEMEALEAEAVLCQLSPEKAAEVRELAQYKSDVAGGLMITELLSYRSHHRVAEVLDDLRVHSKKYRNYDVQYAYITNRDGHIEGVLPFRSLLLSSPTATADELMFRKPICVHAETSLDDLHALFDKHSFFGLPVVDDDKKLLGVVRRADVEKAQGDRSERDHLKSQGIVGGEELRSMRLGVRSKRRLSWLSVNIVLNIAAASVIAIFEDTLTSVIALAVFLPIISDMSGCSGNQAVAVSMRELTLGVIKPLDVAYVWMKEVCLGLVNGLALGLLIGLVAYLWKGNIWLGGVVGAALAINTVIAVSIGGTIPLILKRFGLDPALAAGPVLTTVTDLCGFILVLGLATLAMPYLVAG